MKFIDQSYKIIEQRPGIEGMYLQIERAGRTCYQSIGTRYFLIPVIEDSPENSVEHNKIENILGTWLVCSTGLMTTRKYRGCDYYCFSLKNADAKVYPDYIVDYEISEDMAFEINDEILSQSKVRAFINLTAEYFTNSVLKKNGHGAMLEHGTVYLDVPFHHLDIFFRYAFNKYSRCKMYHGRWLITTNYRVVCEKNAEFDLEFFANNTSHHYKRPCVKFIMDRVGSQSVERHRGKYGISFAQESTRFCNYSNGIKFGEITFIIPRWMYALRDKLATYINSLDHTSNEWMLDYKGGEMVKMLECHDRSVAAYCDICRNAEREYNFLCTSDESEQLKPQDARGVLPMCLKTEFVMTAFEFDWKHFFELRDDSHAHPDIQWISHKLHEEEPFKNL